jgi:hypothetical protein
MDNLCGFLVMHSLAGGTGSGLGARIAQALRESFSKAFLLSVVVAPHRSGETCLQNYNATLCLRHLNEAADGILLLENDFALEILQRVNNSTPITLTHLNNYFARGLACLLLSKGVTGLVGAAGIDLWDICATLSSAPGSKIFHMHCLEVSQENKESLIDLTRALQKDIPKYISFEPEHQVSQAIQVKS